ncbi:hypothetical protein ACYRFS_12830 [Listeria kieliensis]
MEDQYQGDNSLESNSKKQGYEEVRNEILKQINQKKLVIGSRLTFKDFRMQAGNKANYQRALYYLEGAGIQVNEVIIADKVSKDVMQRVGLLNE